MKAKKSVVNTFFINMIIVSFIIIGIFTYFVISHEYKENDEQYQKFQSEFIESKKSMIKNDVNVVVSNIYHRKRQLEGAGDIEIDAVKKDILKWIGKIRLRENQYIVVNTFDGIILSHFKTKNIGKNMWNFTDKNGVKAVQETIKVSKNKDGGYVNYVGSIRPSTGKPGKKITYAKSIPDWEWVVLTGVYLDDIDIVAAQKQNELNENLRGFLLKIAFAIVVAILISFLITRHTAIRLKANFTALDSFFSKAAISSIKIDSKKLFYSEFDNMAFSVNQMSAERNQSEAELRKSEEKYRSFFENSTVSLWEEDFSAVIEYLKDLRDSGVKDMRSYFDDHPEEIVKCASLARILDVNPATLEIYEAQSKGDLIRCNRTI